MKVFIVATPKGKLLMEEGDCCKFGTVTKTKKDAATYAMDVYEDYQILQAELTIKGEGE